MITDLGRDYDEKDVLVKCNICQHVLVSGSGKATFSFPAGSSIACMKCGNKYTFKEDDKNSDGGNLTFSC